MSHTSRTLWTRAAWQHVRGTSLHSQHTRCIITYTVKVYKSEYSDGVIMGELLLIHRCWINIYTHYENPVLHWIVSTVPRSNDTLKRKKNTFYQIALSNIWTWIALLPLNRWVRNLPYYVRDKRVEKCLVLLCVMTSCFQMQLSIHRSKSCQWYTVAARQNLTTVNLVLTFDLTSPRCGCAVHKSAIWNNIFLIFQ